MKKIVLILLGTFLMGSVFAQALLDNEEYISIIESSGDTVNYNKSPSYYVDVIGSQVGIYTTSILGITLFANTPKPYEIIKLTPSSYGYTNTDSLRNDLSAMLFSSYESKSYAYDGSNNMDTMWCILPSADTAYYKVYTYDGSNNLLTESKPQH